MGAKVVTSLFIGAAAGAVLAVLFAPGKGSETRKRIAEKGSEISDELKTSFKDFADCLSRSLDKVKNENAAPEESSPGDIHSFGEEIIPSAE